jgi:hypothetical protein
LSANALFTPNAISGCPALSARDIPILIRFDSIQEAFAPIERLVVFSDAGAESYRT